MCYCSKGLDLLRRTLCLFLCVVLLLCFFLVPRAHAVVAEATTLAYAGLLVGTVLVGAGVVFSSRGDMAQVGAAMYKTLSKGSSAIASKITALATWAVDHGKQLGSSALRVGKDMYQAIVDAFNASYSDGVFSVDGGASGTRSFSNNGDLCDFLEQASVPMYLYYPKDTSAGVVTEVYYFSYAVSASSISVTEACEYQGVTLSPKTTDLPLDKTIYTYKPYVHHDWYWNEYALDVVYTDKSSDTVRLSSSFPVASEANTVVVSAAAGTLVPVHGDDLVYPSDNTLVKMPDIPSVSNTGTVTYPDSIAYTKDAVAVPYPVDTEGVKVPDIPYDKVVDQSTGKTLDDTDTGTDTKPGEGTDTDTDTDVKWPTETDLSLPKLIITKFPFCIPFDVARLIGLLEAEPKAPVFKVPLKYGSIMDEEITLDLSQYSDAIRIVRWGELILFVAGLAYVTKNYIKW